MHLCCRCRYCRWKKSRRSSLSNSFVSSASRRVGRQVVITQGPRSLSGNRFIPAATRRGLSLITIQSPPGLGKKKGTCGPRSSFDVQLVNSQSRSMYGFKEGDRSSKSFGSHLDNIQGKVSDMNYGMVRNCCTWAMVNYLCGKIP